MQVKEVKTYNFEFTNAERQALETASMLLDQIVSIMNDRLCENLECGSEDYYGWVSMDDILRTSENLRWLQRQIKVL